MVRAVAVGGALGGRWEGALERAQPQPETV